MAFNPPINSAGQPMRLEGEYMVLLRKNIEIEIKIDNASGEKKAKGKLFITTARMVFVADKKHPSFSAFDIPFYNIEDEKFEQPVFGANYLLLRVKPLFGLPGLITVKLKFTSGGCGKFIECFSLLLGQIKERKELGPDPAFINDLVSGNLENRHAAFVDPNDPSVVFVSQPEVESTRGDVKKYFESMIKPKEPVVESFGTGQPLHEHNPSFPGAGVQIGGSQQSNPYQGGMIPSNDFQSYPTTEEYPTVTTIHTAEPSQQQQQKTKYPTFYSNQQEQQQQPNVRYYYGAWN